ncbi:hypothetical protein N865_17520, partial [Intrasporangium oryzae NRRL B-24470]
LAAENRTYLPDLASALNNLGVLLSELGRRADALPPTQEAVDTYRALATENRAYLPDLASALNNLGVLLSWVGRRADALPPTQEAVDLRRVLAAENPAYLPGLAGALNNLGNRLSEVGRRADALPPTQEAVDLRRVLAAENRTYLPDLASALNNLGVRLSELGRRADALPPTQEAVDTYRVLAAENPVYLRGLAMALNNLGLRLDDSDQGDVEDAWSSALETLDPSSRALLLGHRSAGVARGEPAAAAWLADACKLAVDDQGIQAALRDEVRRHLGLENTRPAFEVAWRDHSGEDLPGWASLDPDLLAEARTWVNTPTFGSERDYLAAHPDLLAREADAAMNEAMLTVPSDEQERLRELREQARIVGTNEAYQRLTLRELAWAFVGADLGTQQQMLTDVLEDLIDPATRETVAEVAGERQSPRGDVALALLDLAADHAHSGLLQAAFAGLEGVVNLSSVLRQIALTDDARALRPMAIVAWHAATTGIDVAEAGFYLAVANVLDDRPDDAAQALAAALEQSPESRDSWIADLAQIGGVQGQVLTLIPLVTRLQPTAGTRAPDETH